jgi:hypothetical protein
MVRVADSYLSGGGTLCASCHSRDESDDLARLALAERGVPTSALRSDVAVRRCPRCREATMHVIHSTHHTTTYNRIFTLYSGREDHFACVVCRHEVSLGNWARFLWKFPGQFLVGPGMLYFSIDEMLGDKAFSYWLFAGVAIGIGLTGSGIVDIARRLRHRRAAEA